MEKKVKTAALLSIAVFVIVMLPVLYLSFVNRATGDDYGYSISTRAAWMGTHSLVEVGKAACECVRERYYNWQGTWFSIFLFSLQPEVFHDRAYVIVAFLMLFLWIGSTFYLFHQVLCKNIGMGKWSCCLITVCFLLVSIEFIPSTRSSVFWFNGCAHYMVPFAMCQMLAAWLLKYGEEYKKRYLFGIIVFMTLLGGSNYQAALLSLIVACYVLAAVLFLKKDKRILVLLLPILLETAGLIVSMKAPGNNVRMEEENAAGEVLGFSFAKILETIGKSFGYALKDITVYWRERPLIFAGLLFIFVCLLFIFCMENLHNEDGSVRVGGNLRFSHPVWIVFLLFGLYSAMQAPAIYAGVRVSGGVPNTNFSVFLLTALGIMLVMADKAALKIKREWEKTGKKALQAVGTAGILLCAAILFFYKGNIKDSASYVSFIYIVSGQAADYKEQMDLQTRLMEDETVKDVVLPAINDVQGPLMHMPVTEDKKKFTNAVTAQFYGKDSVIMIDRPLWMELYGE
ncbi:MAG: DUF6056 family protein [Bacillus sp. (in: Bacteria)]|nr:DUF6056 family protein [Bacillus sp. (in: firmicutes)]